MPHHIRNIWISFCVIVLQFGIYLAIRCKIVSHNGKESFQKITILNPETKKNRFQVRQSTTSGPPGFFGFFLAGALISYFLSFISIYFHYEPLIEWQKRRGILCLVFLGAINLGTVTQMNKVNTVV